MVLADACKTIDDLENKAIKQPLAPKLGHVFPPSYSATELIDHSEVKGALS